jgi:DNA-binding CsgD family transcriptional regulator
MRATNALLAAQLLKNNEFTQAQLAEILNSAGASPSQIGAILGTTVNTVQVTLSRMRKKQRVKDTHWQGRQGKDKDLPRF